MAWLDNWAKRIKITIDKDQVDTTISGFPTPIYLSTSSGQSNDDVSAIFDELTLDANRFKIAVTDSDGETQLPVEIERWDDANEKAWLHVKVPSISASVDGTLYIYYDSAKANNTTYVGDVGSTPGQSVWDSDFKLVYHLSEDPTGGSGCIKDSTSNVNHGTPSGMVTGDLVDGQFGKCLNFDGSDAYVNCGSDGSIDDIITKTIEAFINFDTFGQAPMSGRIIQKANVNADGWHLLVQGGVDLNSLYYAQDWNNGIFADWMSPADSLTISTWYGIAVSYDKGATANDPVMYIDGASVTVTQFTPPEGTCDLDAANDMWIGARSNSGADREYDGKIDELRISSVIRIPAWIKATYEGLWDDLLIFAAEEEPVPVVFYYEGYITVESTPAARIINLYKRDTGELMDSTTSSGSNGYFKLGSSYDDYHFVVALPDLSENYAILTDDKIHPTGGN